MFQEQGASFRMRGGLLVASGSSGMAITPTSTGSTQYSVLVNFASQAEGSPYHIQDGTGADVLTWIPAKTYQSVLFSSPSLAKGTYKVYVGGSTTGTSKDGLVDGGAYTPGTLNTTFTVSSIVTKVGTTSGPGGPGW